MVVVFAALRVEFLGVAICLSSQRTWQRIATPAPHQLARRMLSGTTFQLYSMDISLILRSVRNLGNATIAWLPRLALALLVIVLAWFVARGVRWAVMRAVRGPHDNLRLALARLAFTVVVSVSVLIAATIAFPSFTVGNLIQLLGVSGVVVGFAFKDIFQNFLAGILILLTHPFTIGDQITVEDHEGTVEEVQTRATLIRTFDRRRVVVPNTDMFTKAVTVNTAFAKRRVEYDVKLPAGSDIFAVIPKLEEILRGHLDGVEKDPDAEVLVLDVSGDGSATLRLRWWSQSERGEYLIVRDRVLQQVFRVLESERPKSAAQQADARATS